MKCHTKRRHLKKGRGTRRRKMRMRGGRWLHKIPYFGPLFERFFGADPKDKSKDYPDDDSEDKPDDETDDDSEGVSASKPGPPVPPGPAGTGGRKKHTKHRRHKKNKAKKSMRRRHR